MKEKPSSMPAELTIVRTQSTDPPYEFITVLVLVALPDGSKRYTNLEVGLAEFALIVTGRGGIPLVATETLRRPQGGTPKS